MEAREAFLIASDNGRLSEVNLMWMRYMAHPDKRPVIGSQITRTASYIRLRNGFKECKGEDIDVN